MQPLTGSFMMKVRTRPPEKRQAYILHKATNDGKWKFVAGMSMKTSKDYLEKVASVLESLKAKTIRTRLATKAALK